MTEDPDRVAALMSTMTAWEEAKRAAERGAELAQLARQAFIAAEDVATATAAVAAATKAALEHAQLAAESASATSEDAMVAREEAEADLSARDEAEAATRSAAETAGHAFRDMLRSVEEAGDSVRSAGGQAADRRSTSGGSFSR